MNSAYLQRKDPRGKTIFESLLENNKEYFSDNKITKDNLEILFTSSNIPLANNSMSVKLNLLKILREHKLTIYEYFDIIESYFNMLYYDIKISKEKEKFIKKLINI